ncbi:AsmA family protein [Pseudomonas sp. M47T1]|uniref:AsmA family protein n=1 Tax=Pseudomonas sp. M47T1 TaxID=1179778 RepID=UPI00026082D0|nr:AsmA family protein [Pseudomonas sp. M47T1]EIK96800.1 AsmA family protein [Pseudomonas sp. M47T1]
MKAFGKILGLCVLGLLLIIVALGFAVTHFFDPNDYKDEIRKLARDKAHVELTLNGDIGWSLFPWLGLELHDASIATLQNPKTPFADLQMLGLSVRVLPLLRREVQMSDVRVEGLNLTLTRDENGHGNWQDIGKALPKPPAPGDMVDPNIANPAPVSQSKPDKADRPVKLDIDSLTVNNARVQFSDARSGRELTAESIQLSTGPVHDGIDIAVKLTAFLGTNQPNLRARTELNGELRMERALKRYQFSDLKLSGEMGGDPLQGKTVTYSAQGNLNVDMGAHVADWSNLKLSINQLRALGDLNARDLATEPKLSGGLSIAQMDLRAFMDSINQPLPVMADGSLGQFEMVARLEGTPNSLALNDLAMKLDGSSFAGNLAIADFAKQALRVQLKADKFDADRYMKPKSAEASSAGAARDAEVKTTEATAIGGAGDTPLPNAPTQGAWSNDTLLPVERLRKLDLQADLSFGQLTLNQWPIDNASLKAQGQNGLITLENLSGGLYDGSFSTKGTLDVRPDKPLVALQTQLNKVPVEHFIKGKNGNPPPVRGLMTLNSNLTGTGNSQKALIDSLNGPANFVLNDGVLVNANLEQQLCQGIATLNRKTLSGDARGKDTPFRELKGSVTIHNGVASNPDLKVSIPGLVVNANGDIDLRVLGMDYRVGVVIEGDKSDMPDPACQVNERIAGIEWPLRCRGPIELGAKACRIDREGVGKVAAKVAGDRITEKLEEKFGDKVSPELKNTLKGLFKR